MRLFGVEDGSFKTHLRDVKQYTVLCGVLWSTQGIGDVRVADITIDGMDVTDRLLEMMQDITVEAVILGGITFAGFNVMDAARVYRETRVPVIVYIPVIPNVTSVRDALHAHFEDWRERYALVKDVEPVREGISRPGEPPVYYACIGCEQDVAETILQTSAVLTRAPEPVRIAGIIARGLTRR